MIFAIVLVVLILFIGLAIDSGAIYVSYGQLKRAVDAAAVSAANDFKRGATLERMTKDAEETLNLHNVDMSTVDMQVFICDADGDGARDAALQTTVPNFYNRCPDTLAGYSPRKLVWVEAHQRAPLYFLQLIGMQSVNLATDATAEAAPVDVVIVLDVSESMASDTIAVLAAADPNVVDNYNPDPPSANACNPPNPNPTHAAGTCEPLLSAKTAAKALIDNLYAGYDQVAVVTFDNMAITQFSLGGDLNAAKNAVNDIRLNDDPPFAVMWPYWKSTPSGGHIPVFNPVNPEDRDGDGSDFDPNLPTCVDNPSHPYCCKLDADRWDETKNPFGWGGLPCDDSYKSDAYDWDGDGIYTDNDDTMGDAWIVKKTRDPDGSGPLAAFAVPSPFSTCTGCGMRMAANILKSQGRTGAVWVIVFLSDGIVNLSDTPATSQSIPAAYKSGFCNGPLGSGFWRTYCIDTVPSPRYCIDTVSNTCPIIPPPPAANTVIWEGTIPNLHYSVYDYATDMVDEAALTRSANPLEPSGNDLAIYTIGLGNAIGTGTGTIGEDLLRYMAAVGDDGDRTTDTCSAVGHRTDCGNYYYAPTGDGLLRIFEDIATRIYTRLTD